MQIQDINKIGVLGAGVMGGGIAQSAIQAGYNVIIRDLTVEICENARETILNSRFGFNNAVKMDKMSTEERDAAMERLSFTTEVNDLKDCDLIIEAIGGGINGAIENKPLKLEVWKEMPFQAEASTIVPPFGSTRRNGWEIRWIVSARGCSRIFWITSIRCARNSALMSVQTRFTCERREIEV